MLLDSDIGSSVLLHLKHYKPLFLSTQGPPDWFCKQVISPTIKGDLPSVVDMYPGSVHGARQWAGVAD